MSVDRSTLPSNVRRWLHRCVPVHAPVPERVVNSQEGEIEVRGKWMGFTAKTVYDRQPFAFQWTANIRIMPRVWAVAEDWHDGKTGWGGANLWGVVPMGGRKGPEVFAMQFVRSLAELPWAPQFVLGLRDLTWSDTSDTTFEVRSGAEGQQFAVTFELDDEGEVTRASSTRPYDIRGGFVEAPWRCEFSKYLSYEGVRVPGSAVATYEKSDGDWTYWRGETTLMKDTSTRT
jgi:hypothetical protein